MPIQNTPERWGAVAQSLHWTMAALIPVQIALGIVAESYPLSPAKLEWFMWHKSVGILLLMLVSFRLGWRLANPTPELPSNMSNNERRLAKLSHTLLYVFMFAMPLSGWVINSAANIPFRVFGIVPLPDIVAPDETVQIIATGVHIVCVTLLAALIGLHIAAAIRHDFVKKDDVLRRMLPGGAHRRR